MNGAYTSTAMGDGVVDQRHGVVTPDRQAAPVCNCRTDDHEIESVGARRRRLRHDVLHEIATIRLLASLLDTADDVGEGSRLRATQLLRETEWLAELLQAYDDAPAYVPAALWPQTTERLAVDALAAEVVAALRLTHTTRVQFTPAEAWTYGNRLALWRALRNVLENAFRAAGPHGEVQVRVAVDGASAVVEVDDDGPGLGAGPGGLSSLGLPIVRDILLEHGGNVTMSTSDLGGSRVRLALPAASAPSVADGWSPGGRACGY